MGVFETLNRGEGDINNIERYFQKRREADKREKLLQAIRTKLQPREELTPEAQGSIDTVGAAQGQEIPTGPRNYGGGVAMQRPQTQTVMPDLNSPDTLFDIGSMAGKDPFELFQLAAQSQEKRKPKYNTINQEGGGYQTFETGYGARPKLIDERKPTFRQTEPKKPTLETANPDDMYWNGTSWEKVDPNYVAPPNAGAVSDQRQRDEAKKADREKTEKRIQDLTKTNQELGYKLSEFDAGQTYELNESGGAIIPPSQQTARQSLLQQIQDNEAELERLNTRIGGTFKGRKYTDGAQPQTGTERIRVKKKSDGTTGTILKSDFNADKYEQLQ